MSATRTPTIGALSRGSGPASRAAAGSPPLAGMTLEEIETSLAGLGQPTYRARQIYEWIYARKARSFSAMTNIPAALRGRLEAGGELHAVRLTRIESSTDGTRKFLWSVEGGVIESVMIPEPSRVTLCISSQVGCALDCRFCLTAQMGFTRHLTAGEIVSQTLLMLAKKEKEDDARPVNIVFMGMGEPLHNYDEVMRAFRLLSDKRGAGIPSRRVTLSTAGMVPGIRRLATEPVRPRLAISLNATTDEIRAEIMPIGRKHPLAELLDAAASIPLPPGERLTFEYVMLEGVNASHDDAKRLVALVRGHRLRAKVNLIPFNPGGGLPFQSPPLRAIRRFRDMLLAAGIPCSIRKNRGRDISAACGQLAVVHRRES